MGDGAGGIGSPDTCLVVVRGPSGAGKSTVARRLRERMGRGTALVEQDYLRRVLMWEKDRPGAPNIGLIDTVVRHALGVGYSVVLDGILAADHYGPMLRELVADHVGTTVCAYLDVSWEETVRRHAGRPQAAEFTPAQMAGWFVPDDRLGVAGELVVPEGSTAGETVGALWAATGRADPGGGAAVVRPG
ncbi:AAA family ATPase [Promicromonospora thailandica]|uniref:AAA domain-containing protein n=1 Tax=Promicromonospora thailandica TaxID=765201 RepID=A0A9X2G5D7_9MICO|nr:AAA family ATPase [Promicromonospora thailandica]MCP2265858.1 AAA domain-containing protein [Promicromonospora thailandica]BFF21581.1 kinase [Promicromonospora thailandica]